MSKIQHFWSPEEDIDLETLGILDHKGKIINPFERRTREEMENPAIHLLKMMMNPDYFYFTCKYLLNIKILPFQCVILRELWYRPFPMLIGSRGLGKSFVLGLYALLRALFLQGRKIVITGAGFRQSKIIMQYAENIWHGSLVLQSLVKENSRSGPHHDADKWELRLGESTLTALPIGDGSKIRGYRANDIIADEFASIPNELFETVISGFGVVHLDPVEKVWTAKRRKVLKNRGFLTDEMIADMPKEIGNQTVISGTGFWQFNHFATYWKKWKGIIESKGDPETIAKLHGGEPQPDLNWRDYAIIRIPVELLPDEFMDVKHIARSRATVHRGIFINEFGACFSADSNGFYKRSLIETCVTTKPIQPVGSEFSYTFTASLKGNPEMRYVYGIDTASESDRFAIVILELHPDHRRIVYCWTSTRKEHLARVEAGLAEEGENFYGFCARKIRELMKIFPCEHLAVDSQGGGRAVSEALHDPDKIREGELPIWEITEFHPLAQGKKKQSDDYPGLHIVEMVNFTQAEYTIDANHGMKKDFEDRVLLFPAFDAISIEEARMSDAASNRIFDTLEDCVAEIEELKEELATIVYTQVGTTGRDRWDTPEVKIEGSKKGRLRKDRYSALVMANAAARRFCRQVEVPIHIPRGGFVGRIKKDESKVMYHSGPEWFMKEANANVAVFGRIIRQ
jgi:hypothetical protein